MTDPIRKAHRTIARLRRMGEIGDGGGYRRIANYCDDCEQPFRWINGEPRCGCPDPVPGRKE